MSNSENEKKYLKLIDKLEFYIPYDKFLIIKHSLKFPDHMHTSIGDIVGLPGQLICEICDFMGYSEQCECSCVHRRRND